MNRTAMNSTAMNSTGINSTDSSFSGGEVELRVNGAPRRLPAGASVADLVAQVVPTSAGVAVAVDEVVVPRSRWETTPVPDGAAVEILTAVQGG